MLRPDFGPESDVDILVDFEPDAMIGLIDFGRLQRALSELIGRDVDLVTKAGLKPAIRDWVLSQARLLYAA